MVRGVFVALALLFSTALAFDTTVAEGTEVFMTNPGGSVIWGYGIVQDGELELSMSGHVGEFLLIVMSTAGEVRAWPGRMAGGKIELVFEGGERYSLEELLTALSLRLSLEQAEPRQAAISLERITNTDSGADNGNGTPRQEADMNGEARLEHTTTANGHEAKSGKNEGD